MGRRREGSAMHSLCVASKGKRRGRGALISCTAEAYDHRPSPLCNAWMEHVGGSVHRTGRQVLLAPSAKCGKVMGFHLASNQALLAPRANRGEVFARVA